MAWDEYKIITSSVCRIITSNRRDIHNVNYWKENIFKDIYRTDIENNAYTYCFGRNFIPIEFTYQQ